MYTTRTGIDVFENAQDPITLTEINGTQFQVSRVYPFVDPLEEFARGNGVGRRVFVKWGDCNAGKPAQNWQFENLHHFILVNGVTGLMIFATVLELNELFEIVVPEPPTR